MRSGSGDPVASGSSVNSYSPRWRETFAGRGPEQRDLTSRVVERSLPAGNSRQVELLYPDGQRDVFGRQLYARDEPAAPAAPSGLRPVSLAGSPDVPQMRLVLERGTPDE